VLCSYLFAKVINRQLLLHVCLAALVQDSALLHGKLTHMYFNSLQCFDAVGWAAGRASGL